MIKKILPYLNYTKIIKNEQFKILAEIFEITLLELENKNTTFKLLLSYYWMVTVLKDFIDWQTR